MTRTVHRPRPHPVMCEVCKKTFEVEHLVAAPLVRPTIAALIEHDHEAWSATSHICHHDLNNYRVNYVQVVLKGERSELSRLEEEVVASLRNQDVLTREINGAFDAQATFGQRLADRVASFGGSWTFLTVFGTLIAVWIASNVVIFANKGFDPYPFILLNLILSCLASVQAPIIMMSQNRQGERDRMGAENDYRVNLKAELEIRHLHARLDLLVNYQWQRLLEIQQVQTDLLNELREEREG